MTKSNIIVFVCMLLSLLSGVIAEASVQVSTGDLIKFADSYGSTGGGEFVLSVKTGGVGPWQQGPITFCLEKGQNIATNGTTYTVESILAGAVNGSGNGGYANQAAGGVVPNYHLGITGDLISGETAWLFLEFTKQTLQEYNFANNAGGSSVFSNRTKSADNLQKAIWKLEGETGITANYYYNLALGATQLAKDEALKVVRAINPIVPNSDPSNVANHRQSQLYVIPEASTIAVWSVLSLVGAGVAYRKRIANA